MARILVIDDDHEMRCVLRQLLEHQNHIVIETADGHEGIVLYTNTHRIWSSQTSLCPK